MADLSQKKANFIRRYIDAVDALMHQMNTLAGLSEEWNANAYATGAEPLENNITDADCANTAPWVDALKLNLAEGALVAVADTVQSQRGYLEAIRP
jgi:hypothetical protein